MKNARSKVISSILAAISLGAILAAAVAQPGQTAATPDKAGEDKAATVMARTYTVTVPDYAAVDPDQMDGMTDEFGKQIYAVKLDLFHQLQRGNLSDARKAELYGLMGGLDIYEATDLLIKDIDFLDKRRFLKLAYQSRGGYTAQRSLVGLGRYSGYAILGVIGPKNKEVPFDKSHVDGYTWVLDAVQGYASAKLSLERELAATKDPVVRAQYQMVLARLEKFPHTD